MKLADFLVDMVEKKASDLFISVDAPPMINVEGRMTALGDQAEGRNAELLGDLKELPALGHLGHPGDE